MADAVRISDGGRIPEPAVVMGVIGNLQDQFCAAIDGERIDSIADQWGILVWHHFPRTAQALPVYKYVGGTEGFWQIE